MSPTKKTYLLGVRNSIKDDFWTCFHPAKNEDQEGLAVKWLCKM